MPRLLHDSGKPLVSADRCVLELPGILPGRGWTIPLDLPGEPAEERARDYSYGAPCKFGVSLRGFLESARIQFGIDVRRLHSHHVSVHTRSVTGVAMA